MFLLWRLRSKAPEVVVTFLLFSISSSVVGGIMFFTDSAAPSILQDMAEGNDIDMQILIDPSFYEQIDITLTDIREIAEEQNSVAATEVVSLLQFDDQDIDDVRLQSGVYLGVESSFFTTFDHCVDLVVGHQLLNDSSCYLEQDILVGEELHIGDNYTISIPFDGTRVNQSFVIAGVFNSELLPSYFGYQGPWTTSVQVIMTRTAIWSSFSTLGIGQKNALQERVWVQFNLNHVSTLEPTSLITTLRSIEQRIEQRTLPYASVWEFSLVSIVNKFASWSTSMRIITLSLAVPSVIIGSLLIWYDSRNLEDVRRQEVGMIKTRGASGFQAAKWVLGFAGFVGVIGSIGAVAIAAVAALLSGAVKELMVFEILLLHDFSLVLLPSSVFILFIFSFTVGLIVGIPTIVNSLIVTLDETHRKIASNSLAREEQYSGQVIQVIIVVGSGLLLRPMMELFVVGKSGFLLIGVGIIILLAVFVFNSAMLFARYAAIAKNKVLGRIRKTRLVAGALLLSKTALVKKRSEATALLFISLVFIAAVFSSVTAYSSNNHMKQVIKMEVGADLVIEPYSSQRNITPNQLALMEQIPGVEHVSPILEVVGTARHWTLYRNTQYITRRDIRVIGIQPETFVDTAFLLPYFTYYESPRESLLKLLENDTNVLSSFRPLLGYTSDIFGSEIPVHSEWLSLELRGAEWTYSMNCTIVDVMAEDTRGAEFGRTFFPGDSLVSDFVVTSLPFLQSKINTSDISKVFIDLADGCNITSVINELQSIIPVSFSRLEFSEPIIDSLFESREGQIINGAYTLIVIFALLYLTIGMMMVVMVKVKRNQSQFSLLRAIGCQPESIRIPSLIDTVIGFILGFVIGSTIGVLLVILLLPATLGYMDNLTIYSSSRLPVTLSIPYMIIIGFAVTSFLFSIAVSHFIVNSSLKSNISEDLKIEE